jgi:endonuclease/exonuclease/phosphatase family metal-dependent hydrolase
MHIPHRLHQLARFLAHLFLVLVAVRPTIASEPTELRLMTYNIHHGEGTDGKLDLERIATIIKKQNCDLVALQEIDRNTSRSQQVDQLARLSELTGMKSFFGKAIDYGGGEYGVGILSKLPVVAHKTWPLPSGSKREQRVALEVVVQTSETEKFVFVCTHLDHSSGENDRAKQTDTLRRLFGNGPSQAILAGDFNATVKSAEMKTVVDKWTDVDAAKLTPTIPVAKPTLKIDYIFLQQDSPWKVHAVEVLNEPIASDHLPLVATLRK